MKSDTGRRVLRTTFLLFALVAFAPAPVGAAQQTDKLYRIGYLSNRHKVEYREEALRRGLRELGYIEGKNLAIEWRFTKGVRQRLAEYASELVRLKVDAIVTSGTGATRAAKTATREIPIPVVMANLFDPVRSGIVTNLARPGENITGFSTLSMGLAGKQMELLREALPHVSSVVLLVERNHPNNPPAIEESQVAARNMQVRLQVAQVRHSSDFDGAFRSARLGRADAVIVRGTGLMHQNFARIVKLAAETRLPVMYTERRFVTAGGLMSYGADRADPYRRAAIYLDKILKGTRPGDLPVQQPAKFDLVINLKTARAAGISLSRSILLRATEIIE